MSLADLEADLRSIPKKPATFTMWLASAEANEVELVLSYLRDTDVPADPLVRKLRANGIPITPETVRSYR